MPANTLNTRERLTPSHPLSLPPAPLRAARPGDARRFAEADPPGDEKLALLAPAIPDSPLLRMQSRGGYIDRNPDAVRQNVYAVRAISGDYGVVVSRDAAFYDLLSEMARNPTIAWALDNVMGLIVGRPEYISFGDDGTDLTDDEAARRAEIQAFVERALFDSDSRFGWETFKKSAIYARLRDGFSATDVRWRMDDEAWVPEHFIPIHPSRIAFGAAGNAFLYDYGARSGAAPEAEPLPDNRVFIVGGPGDYGNPYGKSLIYDLAAVWQCRKSALQAWQVYCDRYGFPLAKGVIKERAQGETPAELETLKSNLNALLRNMSVSGGIVIPEWLYDITFDSRAGGTGGSPHQELVHYCDTVIVRLILGATLQVMEAEFGSRAQAMTHADSQDKKGRSFAAEFIATANRLVGQVVAMNFGEDSPVPRYEMDLEDAIDARLGADLLQAAQSMGLKIPLAVAYDWLGMRAPREGEPLLMPDLEFLAAKNAALGAGIGGGFDPAAANGGAFKDLGEAWTAFRAEVPEGGDFQKWMDEKIAATIKPSVVKKKEFETFAARSNRIARQAAIRQKLDALIDETASADVRRLAESILAAVDGLPGAADARLAMSAADKLARAVEDFALGAEVETLFAAADVLGSATVVRAITDQGVAADALSLADADIDPSYRDAVEWMQSRRVASPSEMDELLRAARRATGGRSAEAIEAAIRDKVLVMKGVIDAEAAVKIRDAVTRAVNEGKTLGEFADETWRLYDAGQLPGGVDAYAQTVFRTETANAYAAQQEAEWADPEIADLIAGFEFFNPDDSASRPSHAAMNGVRVAAGSPEQAAAGTPPWSYACRCGKMAIVGPKEDFDATPDAATRIAGIERF